ncbi:MAG: Rpn family recombination-promoting nuclease/putative transposase [Lachnospiraceae bacterium]|nr:Rpn family recombination-promoting nuclease/putative transposase [Lachnospiraceae bacterium]
MQKHISEKRLEEYNDVLVDIFNNLLFKGNLILHKDVLVPMPTESFARTSSGFHRQGNRDVRKVAAGGGSYRLICGYENQQGRDNTMPLRIMGYDFSSYEEQVRLYIAENKKNKQPAFTKRLHDNQKLAPIVTVVLYWGREEWKSPLCLYDMLKFPKGQAGQLLPYVANYPINLIPIAKLKQEDRDRLTSDFRLIAEYAANWEDPKRLREVMQDEVQKIRHPEEFISALAEITGSRNLQSVKTLLLKKEEREDVKSSRGVPIFCCLSFRIWAPCLMI